MKPSLQNLRARIEQLEAARNRIDAAEVNPPPPMPATATDWEARLSAARAVDSLTGANTAEAIEQARADEQRRIEQHAQEAAKFAQEQARRREVLSTLERDLEAAHSLLEREMRARSKGLVVDALTRYHAALVEVLDALARLAGAMDVAGEQTAANMALMSLTMPAVGRPVLPSGFDCTGGRITAPGRTSIIAQAAAEARELLMTAVDEETEELEHA